jgi:hypothetical protein
MILKALTKLELTDLESNNSAGQLCRAEEDLLAKGAVKFSSALPMIQQKRPAM